MSSFVMSSLQFTLKQIMIYGGLPIFIGGIVGESLNILIFLSLRTFRQNSCAFYLTIRSFVNIGVIVMGLLSRIMISGFNIDWTLSSSFYCKFRTYSLQACVMTSSTCMCLATIDQFLATCSRPYWHQWNNIKFARNLSIISIIFWILYMIPNLVYVNLIVLPPRNIYVCTYTEKIYQTYISYFYLPVLNVISIFITILFGVLAYHNVKQLTRRILPIVRRELDKQLTRMVLVQVVFNCLVFIPYIIVTIVGFTIDIHNNPVIPSELQLITTLFTLGYYLYFAGPFYIYICVSERFRHQFIYVLFTIHLNRWRQRRIVHPIVLRI